MSDQSEYNDGYHQGCEDTSQEYKGIVSSILDDQIKEIDMKINELQEAAEHLAQAKKQILGSME
jgi:hypothetical protein